jgi:hypothetical protein
MNFMVMERRLFTFCFLAVVVWQSVVFAAGTPSFTALTSSLDEAIERTGTMSPCVKDALPG